MHTVELGTGIFYLFHVVYDLSERNSLSWTILTNSKGIASQNATCEQAF